MIPNKRSTRSRRTGLPVGITPFGWTLIALAIVGAALVGVALAWMGGG